MTLTFAWSPWDSDSHLCSLRGTSVPQERPRVLEYILKGLLPWAARQAPTCDMEKLALVSRLHQELLAALRELGEVGIFLKVKAISCLFCTCQNKRWTWKRARLFCFLHQGSYLWFKTSLPWWKVVGCLGTPGVCPVSFDHGHTFMLLLKIELFAEVVFIPLYIFHSYLSTTFFLLNLVDP